MGGLVSTYLLAVADTELTKHIRSITTLDSPLRGTGFLAPFSACDYQSSNAWNDLDLGSAVIETIATLGETANTNKVSSITSLIGAPLPGEAFMEASCGSINPVLAHSCVWNDANALNAVARSINDSPPSVPRLRWHDLSGSEIDRILEGEIVQLHAPVPGLADGETTATILEVDTLDADDLLGTIKLTVKDGIASAKWRAVWTSDGFGIGGDPEYKFVVGNVSSPQLNVVKLPN
jgi:hypothetical protein